MAGIARGAVKVVAKKAGKKASKKEKQRIARGKLAERSRQARKSKSLTDLIAEMFK